MTEITRPSSWLERSPHAFAVLHGCAQSHLGEFLTAVMILFRWDGANLGLLIKEKLASRVIAALMDVLLRMIEIIRLFDRWERRSVVYFARGSAFCRVGAFLTPMGKG
ncbi:MAG: hypothetical protein AAF443_03055 [Chlamydiota bacterium]